MDKKQTSDKLQQGYHAMVDTVESLIKKEGKSLKEALEIAENKLEEWEDLSSDQYKRIRDEVRRDLHSLGEKLDDAKTSFRQRLEMDTNFIKKSAANKLSSLADKTAHELIEIKDSLLNNDEEDTQNEIIQAEHDDHTKWHDDHSFWMTEIAMWRKEAHDAEANILSVHDAINKHEISLQSHVKEIRVHDKAEHDHEKELALIAKKADNDIEKNAYQLAHGRMSLAHKNHALLHQQFKNKHREIMILVERLYDLTHN